uniref:PDZ domain-containing protein n=1 Tax=Chromera velia CCMP2878 TaxID=1169474 RepID=A0A0G4GW25_9ALVE|eukprot:Cvel_23558.t1-p1 / transcript=Cvel_23558.t1 / gene=Cvel_23558 / organism=Chromera_velia_CCMP2878 / gene_product=Putative serine protease HhoB, putative / transcript_product=Putative serine protease HhoB, putative / location=Cvel_scaffold2441:16831-18799(-) / protein_length=401 / sequence_SO=supercontig / SO=protein_coding / is_pseudo=false
MQRAFLSRGSSLGFASAGIASLLCLLEQKRSEPLKAVECVGRNNSQEGRTWKEFGSWRLFPDRLRFLLPSPPVLCSHPRSPPESLISFECGFSEVFERVKPAVVRIYGSHKDSPEAAKFMGSGFVYKGKGGDGDSNHPVAMTAAHLFEENPSYAFHFVRTTNGQWFRARIRGLSSLADVAVVSIETRRSLPEVTTDKTRARPRQGAFVATYGTTQFANEPVGVVGIVSQPSQTFPQIEDSRIKFIQLGLITIPGMSGSPVVDTQGSVVGMVVKKFQEYGLGIPIHYAEGVARCIEETGKWDPPYLGMVLQEHKQRVVEGSAEGDDTESGVMVAQVKGGTPAEKAGIRTGDVILQVGAETVGAYQEVLEFVGCRAGVPVKMRIKRKQKEMDVTVIPTTQRVV